MAADAAALEARRAAEADETFAPVPSEPSGPDRFRQPKVTSLTERRPAQLPPDTRPLPSAAVHDQLRRGRAGWRPTQPPGTRTRTVKRHCDLTEQAADAAIEVACKALRLPTIQNQFADIVTEAAKSRTTYRGCLAEPLLAECDDRARRAPSAGSRQPHPRATR